MLSLKKYFTNTVNCILSFKLPIIIAILASAWLLLSTNDADNTDKSNSLNPSFKNLPDSASTIDNSQRSGINIVTNDPITSNLSRSISPTVQGEITVAARRRSTSLTGIKYIVRFTRYLSQRYSGENDKAGQVPTSEIKKELEEKQCLENAINRGWRDSGWYMSPIKLGLYIFLFLFWTFSASWMNSDMERLDNQKRTLYNTGYMLLYVIICTALLFVPIFWVAFPLTFLICFVPITVYVVKRNAQVPPHEQVLTPEHLQFLFAQCLKMIGVKIKVKKRIYEVGPKIEFEATGKDIDPKILKGRLVIARNASGYNELRQHVYDAITNEATSLMFDFSSTKTVIKHLIDGVWFELPAFPRNQDKNKSKDKFDEMLEAAKLLVGANPEMRRNRQEGSFRALVGSMYAKKKVRYDINFVSQGTQTGEAALLQITAAKVPFQTIAALGVRPEVEQKIIEYLNSKQGLIIVSAPPANGLRSSVDVFSRVCDRFTRDVVNIEDAVTPSEEIENIIMVRYDSAKGESPIDVLPNVLFKEPNAVFVRDMTALPTLELCCKDITTNGRLFLTMIRAKDSVEAILRLLTTKITPQNLLQPLSVVICQKLIRKLCPSCKEPYKPSPQLMQQLGLNPNQVQQLFRTRTPLPEPEEKKRGICQTCNGIGYHGRTALFEIIEMNDSIRGFIISNPDYNAIKQFIQKSGQRSFMHEGIGLVVQGITTVEELSRVTRANTK
ncbi:MAG: Flp pilus assembly complex ATPase component TadA [Planctomycetaceae bacterium]|jgi:type II secretory ATPase GspE/PulE/Tfp pilus assembly ATPase PilB-like protein|nr:Flp pilus assembly complex ATPase component TadA [Planctomycetaceae bacterium]